MPRIRQLDADIAFARNARLAVERHSLRADLAELHAGAERAAGDRPVKPRERRLGLTKAMGMALAAAALALVFAVYFLLRGQDRYAGYDYRDPGLPVVMGVSEDPGFARAMTLFKEENYTEAATEFAARATTTASTGNDTLTYYLGASHYYAKEYNAARPPLQTVSANAASLFQERAQWLLALTQARLIEQEAARSTLREILANPGHRFAEPAAKLLKELDQ